VLRIHLRYLTMKLRALCWVLRQLRALIEGQEALGIAASIISALTGEKG
jgi:hypothetical protein